ncbi:MAG TPA: protocatechuate 3,4-dioxygenase subunit alpha [Ktedonobacterales bacterium]
MSLHATSSQTVGPFFRIGLEPMFMPIVAGPEIDGEHVVIRGRVIDGEGSPIPDALIETWQADAQGVYADPEDTRSESVQAAFTGFGRAPTDDRGQFSITTIKPGRVPGHSGTPQAPHIVVVVFMRGLLRHLITRMYFPDEPANGEDEVLATVPEERRATLIAGRDPEQGDTLVWNIVMQGENETVFFDA